MSDPVAVYKITNTVNGKVYIGQSNRPERRFAEHTWKGSGCKKLGYAFSKYGKGAFNFNVLAWCPNKAYADDVEIKLIAAYDARANGYNICIGGGGLGAGIDNPNYGSKRTEETKAVLRAQKTGVKNHMFGKENTPEQKAKISASLKDRVFSDEHKARISAAKKGKRSGNFSNEEMKRRSLLAKAKVERKVRCYKQNEELIFNSATEAALGLGVHLESIYRYISGRSNSRKGWVVEYLT